MIRIVDAAFISDDEDGLLKIALTADLCIFLIVSDIRYVEMRIQIPLSLLDIAGALNISRILRSFVLSCMNC
jgi:hypothetical protein